MDVGKSFTYIFEDEEWVSKVLMGALFSILSIVLIGIPFILGYAVELVANVRKGEEKPLPTWDDLGGKFRDGLLLIIGFAIYMIPLLVIYCPFIALAATTSDGSTTQEALSLVALCLGCLAFIWAIVVSILSPAITIRFAETRELGAIFRFGDIVDFTRQNLGQVIVALILAWVAGLIAAIVGGLLCGIGLIVTAFWASLVEAHLFGQIGLDQGETPEIATA